MAEAREEKRWVRRCEGMDPVRPGGRCGSSGYPVWNEAMVECIAHERRQIWGVFGIWTGEGLSPAAHDWGMGAGKCEWVEQV